MQYKNPIIHRIKIIGIFTVILFIIIVIFSIYKHNTFADHNLLPAINNQFKSILNKPNVLNQNCNIDTNNYILKYSKQIDLTDSLRKICKQLHITKDIKKIFLSSLIFDVYSLKRLPDYKTSLLFNCFHMYWNDSMNVCFSGNQNLFQRFLTNDRYIIKEIYADNLYTQETWLSNNIDNKELRAKNKMSGSSTAPNSSTMPASKQASID